MRFRSPSESPSWPAFTIDDANALPRRLEQLMTLVGSVGVAVGLFVAQATMLARLFHGAGASLTSAVDNGPWAGPIPPTVLVAAGAVVCAAYGTLLVKLSRPRTEDRVATQVREEVGSTRPHALRFLARSQAGSADPIPSRTAVSLETTQGPAGQHRGREGSEPHEHHGGHGGALIQAGPDECDHQAGLDQTGAVRGRSDHHADRQ